MNPGLEPKLPLFYDQANGPYFMITQTDEMIRQNLKNLFLTTPGEKIMNVNFGIGIKKFLFENKNAAFHANLEQTIQTQVNRYMPYIRIGAINVSQEDNVFSISMNYGIISARGGSSIFDLRINV